jgi:hypothetical protein
MPAEKLRDHLWRQLGFLARSCESFDQGYLDEAIRTAVTIRVLIRQTRSSTSLLTHLDATGIHLLSMCPPMIGLEDTLVFFGLGAGKGGEYYAHLERASIRRMIPVDEWWNEIVYVLGADTRITRKDIVLGAANKDGGAHVDQHLTPEYQKLIDFLQIGSWAENGEREWRDANMHFVALRQMGYELMNSPELLMQAEAPSLPVQQQVEHPALQRFRFLMSERIRTLTDETSQLTPHRPLIFRIVKDMNWPPGTPASAYIVERGGVEEVRLDLDKATEYTVAQNIMYAKLSRLGWPAVNPVLSPGKDRDADLIAGKIIHLFYQYVVDPELIDRGFDVCGYRDQMTRDIVAWPATKVTGHDLFNASLNALEAMLWSESYRGRISEALSTKQPEALSLALDLEKIVLAADQKTKLGIRTAMIRFVNHVDEWVTKRTGHPFALQKRIAVSPILTQDQLTQSAQATTDFVSYPLGIDDTSLWIAGLAMKSDGMLFGRAFFDPAPAGNEPEAVTVLRSRWESSDLNELVAELGVRFGTAT